MPASRQFGELGGITLVALVAVGLAGAPGPVRAEPPRNCTSDVRELRIQQEYERADDLARRCLDESDPPVSLQIEYGRLLAARGQTDRALEHIRRIAEAHPDHLGLRLLEVELLKRSGRVDRALARVDETRRQFDETAELDKLEGTLRLEKETYAEAVDAFDAYLAERPDDPNALYFRGAAHLESGDEEAAEADFRRACDLAPEATKACAALEDLRRRRATEVFGLVRPGYSLVPDRPNGRSLAARLGVAWDETALVLGSEWRARALGDQLARDVVLDVEANTRVGERILLGGGGGVGIAPDFVPSWNAFAEVGYAFDVGVQPSLRFWRIQYRETGASVLVPGVDVYAGSFLLRGDLFATLPDADDPSLAGLLRGTYYIDHPTAVSLGVGAGNRSDFVEFRRTRAESHVVALAGLAWAVSDRSTLGADVVHRRERTGPRRYVQTQFLLRWEYRAPLGLGGP